ncbi:MAG: helix-turn-helix domain-containing protein [Polyangiaceae bacterium]
MMPQRLKPDVRERLLRAARAELAERGLPGMRLAAVAERAESSVGNLYKYFANKQELFALAIPEQWVVEVRQRLEARIAALGTARDAFELAPDHPYLEASAELHAFTVRHRDALRFLLLRATDSPYAEFRATLSEDLTRCAVDYARRAHPAYRHTSLMQRALVRIYRHYLESLGELLEAEPSARRLEGAIAVLVRYHLSGLSALFSAQAEEMET